MARKRGGLTLGKVAVGFLVVATAASGIVSLASPTPQGQNNVMYKVAAGLVLGMAVTTGVVAVNYYSGRRYRPTTKFVAFEYRRRR